MLLNLYGDNMEIPSIPIEAYIYNNLNNGVKKMAGLIINGKNEDPKNGLLVTKEIDDSGQLAESTDTTGEQLAAGLETIKPVVEAVKEIVNPLHTGKDLCPSEQLSDGPDPLHSNRLEEALGILRNHNQSSPAQLANAQMVLYNTIITYLTRKELQVTKLFINNLLQYIEHHIEGHFSSDKKFKLMEGYSNISAAQNKELTTVLGILIDLAPKDTRLMVAKKINWDTASKAINPQYTSIVMEKLKRIFNV